MITKTDCILLLADMKNKGIDTTSALNEVVSSNSISLSVLKFINDNRGLELSAFYENLRKNYNNKKSKLYINIVKEIDTPAEVLTTLSALLTQILLYSKGLENKERQMFLRHSRCSEITQVLHLYFKNYDLENCMKLLLLFKADIKALESIKWGIVQWVKL